MTLGKAKMTMNSQKNKQTIRNLLGTKRKHTQFKPNAMEWNVNGKVSLDYTGRRGNFV